MPVKRSNISWCDYSGQDLNFVIRGNVKGECECSPECTNCYALTLLQRFGTGKPETTFYPEKLARLRTAKFESKDKAFRRGIDSKPIAFACDVGDLFHPKITLEQIANAFDVMKSRSDVDWIVLTKRSDKLLTFSNLYDIPSNVMCGVTVGCYNSYHRLDDLTYVNCDIKFVSVEPMLESIDLWGYQYILDLVFLGGESGANRRPFDKLWAKQIRDFCKDTGTAFHFKQGSHRYPGRDDMLDGKKYKEFPR